MTGPNRFLTVLVLCVCSGVANAGFISTGFTTDNDRALSDIGMTFDAIVGSADLTITGMDVNVDTTGLFSLDVYTRAGTSAGFEETSSGWTLRSTTSGVTGAGAGLASFVDVTDFTTAASSTVGFFLHYVLATSGLNYSDGNIAVSNSDIALSFGTVSPGLFAGVENSPRTWSGTIYYDVGSAQVPLAPTIALFGLGLVGLRFSRRQSHCRRRY